MFEGAQDAINELKAAGTKVFAFTNQHRISMGQATLEDFRKQFKEYGFDDSFICPQVSQEDCECKKPNPGMLYEAAKKHGLDLSRCVVAGDVGEVKTSNRHSLSRVYERE